MFVDKRKKFDMAEMETIVERLKAKIGESIDKHGDNTLASDAEIIGVLAEEQYELLKAVHEESTMQVVEELFDIAVGAVVGIASIQVNSRNVH